MAFINVYVSFAQFQRTLDMIFLQKIMFKTQGWFFSRDLSIDSELLQLQRGTSGDSSADEPDGDDIYRRWRCDHGTTVQDPVRQTFADLPDR